MKSLFNSRGNTILAMSIALALSAILSLATVKLFADNAKTVKAQSIKSQLNAIAGPVTACANFLSGGNFLSSELTSGSTQVGDCQTLNPSISFNSTVNASLAFSYQSRLPNGIDPAHYLVAIFPTPSASPNALEYFVIDVVHTGLTADVLNRSPMANIGFIHAGSVYVNGTYFSLPSDQSVALSTVLNSGLYYPIFHSINQISP